LVDGREGHLVQLCIGRLLLIESLLEDCSTIAAAELIGPSDQCAITRDFVMFDGLRRSYESGIQNLRIFDSPETLLASSRMPSMAGQSTPEASTPCILNTCSKLVLGFAEVGFEALF